MMYEEESPPAYVLFNLTFRKLLGRNPRMIALKLLFILLDASF